MEFIVEKIGMSRTIGAQSIPVTLLRVLDTKVCSIENSVALVAYSMGKRMNKAIEGQQKKYNLSKEFNRFASIEVSNTEVGDLNVDALAEAKVLKTRFSTKGRGFTGVMKRWNFSGGPGAHGHRFHRTGGSIGNREWPGKVQKGRKMSGQYGNEQVCVKNDVVSFDKDSGILVVKGSVPGANGRLGKVRIAKWVKQ